MPRTFSRLFVHAASYSSNETFPTCQGWNKTRKSLLSFKWEGGMQIQTYRIQNGQFYVFDINFGGIHSKLPFQGNNTVKNKQNL